MEKRVYFCTNTKMFKNVSDTLRFLCRLKELTRDVAGSRIELAVMPPFVALYPAMVVLRDTEILLGAQDVCCRPEKECTGEISAEMLQDIGVSMVMIGHSERRHKFHETDEQLNQKVLATLSCGMIPLLCVGETMEEKDCGITGEILSMQLKRGLKNVGRDQAERLQILYEPVWAVGSSGMAASAPYADKAHQRIKHCLTEIFGEETGSKIPVIYGGSVNLGNACSFITQPHIDGLGIGRSAWDAEEFNRIIRKVLQIMS